MGSKKPLHRYMHSVLLCMPLMNATRTGYVPSARLLAVWNKGGNQFEMPLNLKRLR